MTPGYYGMYIYYENYYFQSNSSIIASNMMSQFTSTTYQIGIYAYQNYNTQYLNNTIWVDGTSASYSYGAMVIYYPRYCTAKNNILISTGTTPVISLYISSTSYSCDVDYNLYGSLLHPINGISIPVLFLHSLPLKAIPTILAPTMPTPLTIWTHRSFPSRICI
jgi:hypothetical protein